MKYVDEFRDSERAKAIIKAINEVAARLPELTVMEICGTHTHTISKYGIRAALPKNIKLLSGPGCPVCVTAEEDIDAILNFTRSKPEVTIMTFGDMLRVPGTNSSLELERSLGSVVRVIYSPLDVLDFARANPSKEVVFFSVGFETTAPTVAATILKASVERLENLSLFSRHKLTPPAMKALMDSGEVRIDGFICPGHVTAIIGSEAYAFLAREYASPCVVAGFEPVDTLLGLLMLLRQFNDKRCEIEIEYDRVVSVEGNIKAKLVMDKVFKPAQASWRGIGVIPGSGLVLRDDFAAFDAEERFDIKVEEVDTTKASACICADVLKGIMTPLECPAFDKTCTPETPLGPCMVSSEGTCSAYYRYERNAV